MIFEIILPAVFASVVSFVFAVFAAYVGTLVALDVFFDPERDSVFLSNDADTPPGQ